MTDWRVRSAGLAPSSAMDFHLPPHVSFGLLGERAVALDLAADRYFLISPLEAAALAGSSACAADRHVSAKRDALVRRGLLARGAGAAIEPVVAEAPLLSALETESTGADLAWFELACCRASAGLQLRLLGLRATLDRSRKSRHRYSSAPGRGASRDAAIGIAQGYANARLLLPAKQLCVPDSLALAHMLWRRGLDADVYFGVRLEPFLAHAWVQRGDLLLSDMLNTVSEYTPVFRL